MVEHHDGHAWLILDAAQCCAAIKEALAGGLWFFQSVPSLLLMLSSPRASTLAELGARVAFDPAVLYATAGAYNRAVYGKIADPLGKTTPYLTALGAGP